MTSDELRQIIVLMHILDEGFRADDADSHFSVEVTLVSDKRQQEQCGTIEWDFGLKSYVLHVPPNAGRALKVVR